MYLIAGLGNPGGKYEATRHNVGFMVVDYLADMWGLNFNKVKSKGLVAEGQFQGEKTLLVKPQTYMNLSGESIGGIVNFYKIPIENVIIIYDDIDLEPGRIRIRTSGSSGGQRGMDSIINHLKTKDILRVKVGIGRNSDPVEHVLGTFSKSEWEIMKEIIPTAAKAAQELLMGDIEGVMNTYNKK